MTEKEVIPAESVDENNKSSDALNHESLPLHSGSSGKFDTRRLSIDYGLGPPKWLV